MSLLTRLSLRNRALVALATVITVLVGLFSTTSLKQELIPSLEFPIVAAVTPVPGADSATVEDQVTIPIEDAAATLEGVETVDSSSSGGISVVTVQLMYGTSLEDAQSSLQNQIAALDLPGGAEPEVIVGAFDDFPVINVAASGGGSQEELVDRLNQDVIPRIEQIQGVREVQLTGVDAERVEITLDQEAAAAAGVTPQTVATALETNGVTVPAGSITQGEQSLAVQVGTPLGDLEALRAIPLAATPGTGGSDATAPPAEGEAPAPTTLGEVAEVALAAPPATGFTRTDGEPSVALGIIKTPDGNTVDISHELRDELEALSAELGQQGQLTVVFDQAPFVEQSIEDLTTEGLLGLSFAILVVLVFLLSIRLTLVTAVSIPLSLLIAMIGLYLVDYSLNILTLGALTIAVGRVVDDSIVVIENIKRHLDTGEPKAQAIPRAVGEVAGAITSSTLATAAVFVPLGLVGGQVGELFRPFAFTVALALLASLLVALTIIPVLGYWFLGHSRRATARSVHEDEPDALQRGYLPMLRFVIRRPLITVLAGALVLIGTFGAAGQLKTDFLGSAQDDQLILRQELEPGTSLDALDEASQGVEATLRDMEGVESVTAEVGDAEGGAAAFGGGGAASSQFYVSLSEAADAETVRSNIEDAVANEAGRVTVSGASQDPSANETSVVIRASEPAALRQAAAEVEQAVHTVDGAQEVTNNISDTVPALQVDVDRRAALSVGLPEAQVGQLIAGTLQGTPVGQASLGGEALDVVISSGDRPTSPEELSNLVVASAGDRAVTLGEVAEVERVDSPVTITRTDGERSATITVVNGTEDLGAFTTELTAAVEEISLPQGVDASVGGVSEQQGEAFADLGLALLVAIGIVYLVMVAAFRSLAQPLILLVSIPFAATGAIGMLFLTGVPLGIAGMIGMLMLIGIVVTNAIVLIDLVNQYRGKGLSIEESVIEGSRHRLRPILMTALATIMALTPMAFALTGGGSFISQPLALVVIGGLITSTALTLLLVPALYVMLERGRDWLQRRAQRRAEQRAVGRGDHAVAAAAADERAERQQPADSRGAVNWPPRPRS